jgi:glycosyltransferase involved in cell wall biosynthesis
VSTGAGVPRVLFAIGTLEAGGSENQLSAFAAWAHQRHLHATVVTRVAPRLDLPNEQLLRDAGVERRWLGFGALPRAARWPMIAWNSDRLVRELRPDLMYCWLESSSLFFCPPARARGVPVLVARRNVEGAPVERVPPIRWAIRGSERMAQLVTANSHAVIDTAVERGIRPDRLRLVPNAHRPLPPIQPPDTDVVSLGYVAAFRREKGHLRLLEVLSRLCTEVPWRIDLAGEGPLVTAVQKTARAKGLGDRVRCVGGIRDARAFWRDHHIAVLLSDSEGLPNALIEAAIAGRPIVATDVGGTPDVVAPAGGLLVPVSDADAGAEALKALIEDPELRQRFGAHAHAQAVERFPMEKSFERHLEVIHEGLGLSKSARTTDGRPTDRIRIRAGRVGRRTSEASVLVLTPYPYGKVAGPRSSFELWEPVLSEAGIRLEYAVFETDELYQTLLQPGKIPTKTLEMARCYARYLPKVKRAKEHDAVLINREAALVGPALLERWVASTGKPIIYQLDDPLYIPYRSNVNGVLSYLKFFGKVATICRLSTVVIANSAHHAAYARRHNENVRQIPSLVDGSVFTYLGPNGHKYAGEVCIGWTGSATTAVNLRMIRKPLAEIGAREDVRLRFLGAEDFGLEDVPHEALKWNAETEVDDIRSFDIGLLPVPDSPWSRRKFYLKLVQYMALGIPAVATPIGSNTEVLKPGITGLFASSDDEWISSLECLVSDKERRAEMGERAAELAHARYTLQANADRIVEAFESAIGDPRG